MPSPISAPCVLTIGNFDGVHKGHQMLIQTMTSFAKDLHFRQEFLVKYKEFADCFKALTYRPIPKENPCGEACQNSLTLQTSLNNDAVHDLKAQAKAEKDLLASFESGAWKNAALASRIVTFSPHPAKVLGTRTLSPLMTDEIRLASLKQLNTDHIDVIFFHKELAKLSCEEFCIRLMQDYQMKVLCIGHDFKMGYDRGGYDRLKEIGQKHGFCVHPIEPVSIATTKSLPYYYLQNNNKEVEENKKKQESYEAIICSTNIRLALSQADVELANAMLGHNFTLCGKVEHGAKRGGHLLGFPTANLQEEATLVPKKGVYVTKTRVLSEKYKDRQFFSVTNIGYNPTFGEQKKSIETFIMDFDDNIYGMSLEIEFICFIRDEKKFESADQLAIQIKEDVKFAKNVLEYYSQTGNS